jgi:hypothetical protein
MALSASLGWNPLMPCRPFRDGWQGGTPRAADPALVWQAVQLRDSRIASTVFEILLRNHGVDSTPWGNDISQPFHAAKLTIKFLWLSRFSWSAGPFP